MYGVQVMNGLRVHTALRSIAEQTYACCVLSTVDHQVQKDPGPGPGPEDAPKENVSLMPS